jgi:hypothetical protein
MSKNPLILLAVWAVAFVSGCAWVPTQASPPPASAVESPEKAIAQVVRAEPRLAGITARNEAAVGQASWFVVARPSGSGAFVVTVRVGWGDCESGCMDEHRWQYAVEPSGSVSVVSESGPLVPETAWPAAPNVRPTGIAGKVTAGPVCPVERIPPDPAYAPKPVRGAVIVVRQAAGIEVARVTTAADGTFFVDLAPGAYMVDPTPVTGLMGTAPRQNSTVVAGAVATVDLEYDTGIR